MKYKCCNLIQHGLCFFCGDLVSCCFSPNDQIEGGRPPIIIPDYKGELISKAVLFGKIKEYTNIFKNGGCPKECTNCYHIEEKDWDEEEYINSITITHFSYCNADCIYCTNNLKKEERTNEKYEILPVLRDLKQQDIIKQGVELHIGGGEFTVYKEFEDIIEEFAITGFAKVYIPTNAIKYSEKLNTAIKKGHVAIIVSLDCGCKKTYKKIKRIDAFDTVVKNLKTYASDGIKKGEIALKYIVIPSVNDNLKEFKKFLNTAKGIGIEHIIIDLDARYARELNYRVENILIQLVKDFEETAKREGFSTETYSFFSQCNTTKDTNINIIKEFINYLKYKLNNKTAKKLYSRNSLK